MNISRRRFLKCVAAAAVSGGTGACPASGKAADPTAETLSDGGWRPVLPDRLKRLSIPPLFVTAYITPSAAGQGGQEAVVARYPLALVPQDTRNEFHAWRDKVKQINPDILLLGYHMVNTETTVPGPGHDQYRALNNPFMVYPGGYVPAVGPAHKRRRLFDMRRSEWRVAFIQGCSDVLRSYRYDGLYLDNCTVAKAHHPYPWVRDELRQSLQGALIELRRLFPAAILIGNCRENWVGLNGEMNERRPRELAGETQSFPGHTQPEMDLYSCKLTAPTDKSAVRRGLIAALETGSLFGAAVDYQHALWFGDFDNVIEAWESDK